MSMKKKSKKTPSKEKPVKAFNVNNIFDENSFDFHLAGGPLHTELLIASAIYKLGDKEGEPVPIKCKWFNIKENGQLMEIENVSGAFYQPCVEDVGSKIYVQATPISSLEEYSGMPVFSEVGPLIMNKEIETRVTAMLSKNECILNSRIDSANFPIIKNGKNFQLLLPLDCQIKIDENSLYLSINGEDPIKKQFNQEIFRFPLQLNFPYIKICRMTNNVYEIYFQQDQTIRMMAENNITRDIIAVTLKMFCGQKILDHKFLNTSSNEIVSEENFESPKKNQEILEKEIKISEFNRQEEQYIIKTPSNTTTSELKNDESIQKSNKPLENINKFSQESKNSTELLLLKIEDQAREINRLNQENDLFRKEKSHNSEESLTIIKEKEQLSTELFQIKHNYMEVLRENEQFKTKLEKLLTEKNFLLQDLTLYQTQLKSNEENTISLETKISILTKEYEEKNLDQTQNCEIQLKKNEISQVQELEKEIMGCKQEIKILNDQLIIKLSTIKELSQSNEDLENKINYLMKKTESMKYETSKSFQSNNNHIHDRNNNEELDIEKLQLQVVGFEKTIKELKKNLEEEQAKKVDAGKFELSSLASIISNIVLVKSSNQQVQYMQKLANNLTEVITDREMALQNQKNINKELIKRINEMEDQVKNKEKENL